MIVTRRLGQPERYTIRAVKAGDCFRFVEGNGYGIHSNITWMRLQETPARMDHRIPIVNVETGSLLYHPGYCIIIPLNQIAPAKFEDA